MLENKHSGIRRSACTSHLSGTFSPAGDASLPRRGTHKKSNFMNRSSYEQLS
jgi:hypothetical protein